VISVLHIVQDFQQSKFLNIDAVSNKINFFSTGYGMEKQINIIKLNC
jgi:hypothetical protein